MARQRYHPPGYPYYKTPNPVPKDQQIPKWGTWPYHLLLLVLGTIMGIPGVLNLMYVVCMRIGHNAQKRNYQRR